MTKELNMNDPYALWDMNSIKSPINPIELDDEQEQVTSTDAPQSTTDEETTQAAETPDETQGLSEETTENIESSQLNPEETNWKKRYDDLRNHLNAKTNEIKSLVKENQELKKKPDITQLATEEEIEEYAKQYPEAYALFKAIAVKTNKELEEKTEELKRGYAEIAREKAFNELLKEHPDAGTIRDSQDFKDWLDIQTRAIQGLYYSDEIPDAVKLLNLYKADRKPVKKVDEKKKEKADASLLVSTPSRKGETSAQKRIWKESEITDAIYSKYKHDIDAAQREGRLIMDRS